MLYFATNQPFFSAYTQADLFGKGIFFVLFLISIISWITLIQKFIQTRKAKQLAFQFEKNCKQNKEHLLNVTLSKREKEHPFAQVFSSMKEKTLEILNKNTFFHEEEGPTYLTPNDLEQVESHVLVTISSETKKLEKNLFLLSMIYTLAPFLGLLGTVWGILVAFSELQKGTMGASSVTMLGGLSTALSTTVLGLLIAIPALIGYSYLRNTLKHLYSDMEDFMYGLLSVVEIQYRKPL